MDVAPFPSQLPPFASLRQIRPFDCLNPPQEVLLEIQVRNFINEFLFSEGEARDVGIARSPCRAKGAGDRQPDDEALQASAKQALDGNAGRVGLVGNAQCGSLAEADAHCTVSTNAEAAEQKTLSPAHSLEQMVVNDENIAGLFKGTGFAANVHEKYLPNSCRMEEVILDVIGEESALRVDGSVCERDASSVPPGVQADKSTSEAVRGIFCKAWNLFRHSESSKQVIDSTYSSTLPLYEKVKDIPTFDGVEDQARSFGSQHRRIEGSSCSIDLQDRQNISRIAGQLQKPGARLPLAGQAHKPSHSKKPPRPSRSSRLPSDPSQTGLKRCVSDTSLAQISKKNERTRSRRRKLTSTTSNSTSLWALIVTICFAIIMVAQGIFSQGNRGINDTVSDVDKGGMGAPIHVMNNGAGDLSPVITEITDHFTGAKTSVDDHRTFEQSTSVKGVQNSKPLKESLFSRALLPCDGSFCLRFYSTSSLRPLKTKEGTRQRRAVQLFVDTRQNALYSRLN